LSLVRVTPLPKYHKKILIFRGRFRLQSILRFTGEEFIKRIHYKFIRGLLAID
jgi:hypothetical protein